MGRELRVVCGDIYYGEGPRWRDGRLWFSDFFGRVVKSVSPAGDVRREVEADDMVSGLGWMPDGSMLIVSMTKRQLIRRFPDGTIRVHADLSSVADFHCNDMVVDAAGRAYVGNFGFDLYTEVAQRGVESVLADHKAARLACVLPDGTVREAASGMHFPNGSVITPDGKTLIVGETFSAVLTAFDIGPDGVLSNRRVWAPLSPRVPDGIALNAEGNIWVANPLAPECVLVAPGGEVREIIDTGMNCFACMLGGDDGRTLFMLIAPTYEEREASRAPKGKLVCTRVEVPHAGLP